METSELDTESVKRVTKALLEIPGLLCTSPGFSKLQTGDLAFVWLLCSLPTLFQFLPSY